MRWVSSRRHGDASIGYTGWSTRSRRHAHICSTDSGVSGITDMIMMSEKQLQRTQTLLALEARLKSTELLVELTWRLLLTVTPAGHCPRAAGHQQALPPGRVRATRAGTVRVTVRFRVTVPALRPAGCPPGRGLAAGRVLNSNAGRYRGTRPSDARARIIKFEPVRGPGHRYKIKVWCRAKIKMYWYTDRYHTMVSAMWHIYA